MTQPIINLNQIRDILSHKVIIENFDSTKSYKKNIFLLHEDNIYLTLDDITPGEFNPEKFFKVNPHIATNLEYGLVKGSTSNGQVSVENGEMFVNGWNSKQDKLVAGANISINGNIISSTGVNYRAGYGLIINLNEISVNTNIIATMQYVNNALALKQNIITDLETIRDNAELGKISKSIIDNYGNIVTHNVSEFATSAQGIKADSAIQPNDNISELTNDVGYITESYHDDTKQDTLTAGDNISIESNIISATDTKYTAGNGLTLNGTTFSANVIDSTSSTSSTNALSANMGKELQDQINNLKQRGRYLSVWDCTTGLATTIPTIDPYPYKAGDYFIIGKVGETNYRPNGEYYSVTTPSTTIETETVKPNDTYYYDGTTWSLLTAGQIELTFENIGGSPYDNSNLASALNAKLTANYDIEGGTFTKITFDNKGLVLSGSNLTSSDIPKIPLSKINGLNASTTELNYNIGLTGNIQSQLDSKQPNLTAGEHIDITNNTISAVFPEYISLERLGEYVYRVTYDSIPEYKPLSGNINLGACTTFVRDGKLYRNFDWKYDNTATFQVICKDFQGTASITGLDDSRLDIERVEQLPYHVVDGVNKYGIMVTTHVLYNDWKYTGCGDRNHNIMLLPYYILSNLSNIDSIDRVLEEYVRNIEIPRALLEMEYLVHFVVSDGRTTYCIMPPDTDGESYSIKDITENPKLTNFRWVSDETVDRHDLQERPTGVERWNEIATSDLEDLRFTKCYETPDRLSEFIGERDTTKDSPDAELYDIYLRSHDLYLDRHRDGTLWQTVHSIVLSPKGIEHFWVQENWDKDYNSSGNVDDVLVDGTSVVNDKIAYISLTSKQNVTDNNLATTSKTIVGAINELNSRPSAPAIDNITITKNTSNELQTVAVINQNGNTALKEWKGTLLEYNALGTYDDNTAYIILDDYDGGAGVYTKGETDNLLGEKVNKTNTSNIVYGTNSDGEQQLHGLVYNNATAWSIPRRNGNGQIITGTPTEDNHATTKQYVDNGLSTKQGNLTAGSNIAIDNNTISATDTTYSAGNGLTLNNNTFSANVVNNVTSTSTTNALSANMGKSLQEQINNLNSRGKYLSVWDCTTGLAMDEPPVNPYTIETGSFFIVGKVGTTNYRPNGGTYNKNIPSTTIETNSVKVNDTYYYDGTAWRILETPQVTVAFSTIAGNPEDNVNLKNDFDAKQNVITGAASTIVSSDLTPSRAALSDSNGKISVSTVTSTELGYLSGTTSSIQTQLGNKANASSVYTKGETDSAISGAISTLLGSLYPVGSIYIGTQATCPMATLISGSTWELVSAGRTLQGSDGSHAANTTIEAGLPNITGGMQNTHVRNNVGSSGCGYGAVAAGANRSAYTGNYLESTGTASWSFDASRVSSIYKNNFDTVQPPAYVVNIWRRTA